MVHRGLLLNSSRRWPRLESWNSHFWRLRAPQFPNISPSRDNELQHEWINRRRKGTIVAHVRAMGKNSGAGKRGETELANTLHNLTGNGAKRVTVVPTQPEQPSREQEREGGRGVPQNHRPARWFVSFSAVDWSNRGTDKGCYSNDEVANYFKWHHTCKLFVAKILWTLTKFKMEVKHYYRVVFLNNMCAR